MYNLGIVSLQGSTNTFGLNVADGNAGGKGGEGGDGTGSTGSNGGFGQ